MDEVYKTFFRSLVGSWGAQMQTMCQFSLAAVLAVPPGELTYSPSYPAVMPGANIRPTMGADVLPNILIFNWGNLCDCCKFRTNIQRANPPPPTGTCACIYFRNLKGLRLRKLKRSRYLPVLIQSYSYIILSEARSMNVCTKAREIDITCLVEAYMNAFAPPNNRTLSSQGGKKPPKFRPRCLSHHVWVNSAQGVAV